MTTKVTYKTVCDLCGAQISEYAYDHLKGAPLVEPNSHGVFTRSDVCDTCYEPIRKTIDEVIEKRRPK